MVADWDPEWLELAKNMGPPPSLPDDFAGKKAMVEGLLLAAAERLPPPPENVVSKDLEVPNGPKVRAYKPIGEEGLLPMIIFCHGGGWFAGNLDTEDRSCRMICSMTPAWVISVDYRCAADVPLEDEVDDCYKGFEWAYGRAEAHGADPNKVIVWGGSAGGSLAIALVYRLIKEGKGHHVAGLCLMNSLTVHVDATPERYKALNTSMTDNAGFMPFVSAHDTLFIFEQRNLQPPNTKIDLFPAAGGPDTLRGFPPTFITTSENDPGRDDGTVFEAMLKDVGVPVKRENFKGLAHYFWVFPLPKANASFWSKLSNGFRWIVSQKGQSEKVVGNGLADHVESAVAA